MKERYDTIIIGAGPGGLSAAIYSARAGKSTLLLEKLFGGGQAGMLTNVANYPGFESISGYELLAKMRMQAENSGCEICGLAAIGLDASRREVTVIGGQRVSAERIIVATGCKVGKLGLDREDELFGRGVSYCATCDGNFFKGKTVAVVGEGRRARESADYLKGLAAKTYFITSGEEVDGVEKIQGRVTALYGTPLESIEVKNERGAFIVPVDGLFVSVGLIPQTQLLVGKVELDERGFAITDENMRTSAEGIYAVGDIRKGSLRQIVTAASDGAIAACDVINKKRVKK